MAEEPQQPAEVSPEPAKKTRAPRKSVRKTATPAAEEAGAAAPPDKPKKTNTRVATRKRSSKTVEIPAAEAQPEAAPVPVPAPLPAPAAPSPAPAEDTRNAKPLNTSEERADTSSEERPLVRNLEQSPQKPVSVPGFATPETVGGEQGGGNGRRKRRRNRNRRGEGGNNAPQSTAPLRVDAEELNRRAWKIFLGEVTEEGLALMDDRTAAEAARRAFRMAELFLQEAARHRPAPTPEPSDVSESPEGFDAPEEEPEAVAEA